MSGVIVDPRFRIASANPTLPKIVDGHLDVSYTTKRDTTGAGARFESVEAAIGQARNTWLKRKAEPVRETQFESCK